MAVLVTGGTGDLGSYVVKDLVSTGAEVVAFDISPRPAVLSGIDDKVKLVKGNITNMAEVMRVIKENKIDTVVHLAGLLTMDGEARPHETAFVNTVGSLNVFEAARLADIKRIIYASTSSVYGNTPKDALVNESFPPDPQNVYATSKYSSEAYGHLYGRKYGFEFCAIRLRVLLSPGQRKDTGAMLILAGMIDDVISGRTANLPVAANEKMIFTYVRDGARAFKLAFEASKLGMAYNIMSGQYAIGDVATALQNIFPGSKILPPDPSRPYRGPPITSFGRYDISRAEGELGYRPGFSLEQILRDIIDKWSSTR